MLKNILSKRKQDVNLKKILKRRDCSTTKQLFSEFKLPAKTKKT